MTHRAERRAGAGRARLLVEGELRHVFVDRTTLRKTRDPAHVREGLSASRSATRRAAGRLMLHLRIVAPAATARHALELLCGSPSVLNVVHLDGRRQQARRAT